MPLPLIIPIIASLAGTNIYTKIVKANSTPTPTQTTLSNKKTQAMNASTLTATATAGQTVVTYTYPASIVGTNPTVWDILDYYNAVCEFYIGVGAPDLRGDIDIADGQAGLSKTGVADGQQWFAVAMPLAVNAEQDYIYAMQESIYYTYLSQIMPSEMNQTQTQIKADVATLQAQQTATDQKIASEFATYKMIFNVATKIATTAK